MEKSVTLKYNIGITFVFIAYAALSAPFMPDDDSALLISSIFEKFPAYAVVIGMVTLFLSLLVFMYAVRSIWNRLFPKICGWKEINLAEAYAISMIVAFLFLGL